MNYLKMFVLFVVISAISGATQGSTTENSALPPHPTASSDQGFLPPATGSEIKIGNLSVYESGNNSTNSSAMLIAVYDLFGFHPHVKYVADKVSEAGLRVVIPDFFHNKPYDVNNFPPPNFQDDISYLFQRNGSWDTVVKYDVSNVIQFYKNQGVTKFGIFGFCWGGKMTVFAASDPQFTDIKAAGLVHPSKVVTSDADNALSPMILLPSKDEPDMEPFLKTLTTKFGYSSELKRFDDMKHGYAGARSDFSNTLVKNRVDESIKLLQDFFAKKLLT